MEEGGENQMKKTGIFQLATLLIVLCLLPSNAFGIYSDGSSGQDIGTGGPEYKEGEVLVKFRPGIKAKALAQVQSRLGLRTLKSYPRFGVHHLSIESSGLTVKEAVKLLSQSPEVLYAEPNYRRYAALMPNDPRMSELWGLHNTGQTGGTADADIDAPEAWDITTGSSNIVVAVIDTGVDYAHPDLAANMWTNPGEIPGNSVDDDGNGYVDDVYGIDAANRDTNPMDDHDHGTHCSGTIGGVGNNGVGVAGVNWNVKIMALKFLDQFGGGWTDDAIECVDYTVMMKNRYGVNIRLSSNSWGGGGFSQALEDAIAAAGSAGMLFVAAAGNSGTNNDSIPHYPSNYDLPNVVAVAATNHNDNLASFSSYGAISVDLAAPGVSILSTTRNNSYSHFDGTSMATPHVAGAAALLWANDPTLTNQEVKEILLSNVDLLPALNGRMVSGGRLNVFNALTCESTGVRFAVSLRDGFLAEQGRALTITAYLTECSFLRGAALSVAFTNGDPTVTLVDNGVAPDVSANDGVYTGSWTPNALGPVTADFTAMHGGNVYTASASSEVVLFSGYYTDNTVPYSWIEISGTGTRIYLTDDDHTYFPVPFPVRLYGESYSNISINSNGIIYFVDNYDDFPSWVTMCIPSANDFGVSAFAAPFWTDLDPSVGGAIYYEVRGTPPDRMLIVEYANLPHYWTSGTVTFEIIFYEGSDDILGQYKDVTLTGSPYNYGAASTLGVQRDASYGQQYSCSEPVMSNLMAILWYRYVPDDPTISRSPGSLSASCERGANASSQTFEVWNSGAGGIAYTITDNADWLVCVPNGGSSTGERDTITVNYTTSGLGMGEHSGTITISDPGAINSPQLIEVSLTVTPPSYLLSTDVSPGGAGSVVGGGSYFEDSVATVQAVAGTGWEFDHWEGNDIAGSTANPEQITMDTDKSVTAVFTPIPTFTLTVNLLYPGCGVVIGGGPYTEGKTATVMAHPNPGWSFDHWEGDDIDGSTQNPEEVIMNSDKTVTAVMLRPPLSRITLTYPSNRETMYSGPMFTWQEVSGTDNYYKVDMVLAIGGRIYTSPAIVNSTYWLMPYSVWNAIPSGIPVYWRVRGADLASEPISIINSDQVWTFHKH
jgi:hypothetical protein